MTGSPRASPIRCVDSETELREYHYEDEYEEEPEKLNEDGECFSVVIARDGGGEPDGAPQFSQFA